MNGEISHCTGRGPRRAWLLWAALAAGAVTAAPPATPLRPEKAYRYDVSAEAGTVTVHWHILPGYYLYKERMSFASRSPDVEIGPAAMPPGLPHDDDFFGHTEIYRDDVDIPIPLGRHTGETLELEIRSQGCADIGLCYPPQVWTATVALVAPPAAIPDNAAPRHLFGETAGNPEPPRLSRNGMPDSAPAAAEASLPVSEQDAFAGRIARGSLVVALALSFVAGIGLSLLPCCWPMIPILSGIIVGDGQQTSTRRSFALSITYVLGMAIVYAAAGALAAAAGQHVQAAMQTPWVIAGVAGLFAAMAASMFGLFELTLPGPLANRLNAANGRQQAGTYVGAAVMGALSSLVVSACVAPPLVGVLTFIAQTGNIIRGALALFAMGVGMGVPLLVIGASGGRLLPKAGAWMTQVKGGFGFVMLGLAVWMLDRILPATVTLALWGILLFVAATFLGAFRPLGENPGTGRSIAKAAGLLGALWGGAMVAGALAGQQDPFQPLAGFTTSRDGGRRETGIRFQRIKTVADLDQALGRGAPVMLDFYADWCVSCKEMERDTFRSPEVAAALAGVTLVQADVTANDPRDKDLLARFGIFGPPTIVFFGADGREKAGERVVGYMPAREFAAHVRQAVATAQGP